MVRQLVFVALVFGIQWVAGTALAGCPFPGAASALCNA
jgi:hypothetical protein